jgi:hypothetical protein
VRPLCLHEWTVIERVTHAEIDEADPLAHTAFAVIGCVNCRTVDLFPVENAALVTPRYLLALRRDLAGRNWCLPADLAFRVHHQSHRSVD